MRIFILHDGVDTNVIETTRRLIKGMPSYEFIEGDYSKLRTEELVDFANTCDLVHYNNFDISSHLSRYKEIKCPFLYTVRSDNFPPYVYQVARWATKTIVVTPKLGKIIPNSFVIADGVDEKYEAKEKFVVGYIAMSEDSKRYNWLKKACEDLNIELVVADANKQQEMNEIYDLCDLFVCVSETECFSKHVMECVGLNKPVLTTRIGAPATLNLHFIYDVSPRGITAELEKFCTTKQLFGFTWETAIKRYRVIYNECVK